MQALMEAAENGKEVVALVELRARFDEQNNIDWSKQLEEAGCTVIYGFDDYKVHSKLTLITSKSADGYSYITQIGTGNYNEKTSELYTDYSFITADQGIGEEASNVFQQPGRAAADRGERQDAGGTAALQERAAGRDGPRHRRRPSWAARRP